MRKDQGERNADDGVLSWPDDLRWRWEERTVKSYGVVPMEGARYLPRGWRDAEWETRVSA